MTHTSNRQLRILEKETLACRDITALLGELVDGELLPSLQCRVEQHILICPQCAEGEARYREVIELASELPKPEIPFEVQMRLRLALNKRLGLNLSVAPAEFN